MEVTVSHVRDVDDAATFNAAVDVHDVSQSQLSKLLMHHPKIRPAAVGGAVFAWAVCFITRKAKARI